MKIFDVEQNSPEWRALRVGKITASCMDNIITPTGEKSKQVDKYLNKLLAEQITGEDAETFAGNADTLRGKEYEQEAADYYAMTNGVELHKVGFCTTDDGRMGCSPDRFVDNDGILEIKTALPRIMIEYHLSGKLEEHHRPQTQSTLYITERQWADTMLYNPNILLKPIVIRSTRNGPFITSMLQFADSAFALMEQKRETLKKRGFFTEDPSRFLRAG